MSQNETKKAHCLPLTDRIGYLSFLVDMLEKGRSKRAKWDGRKYGTLVTWAKLFADIQGWIPKAPINLTQTVTQTVDLQREAELRKRSQEKLRAMDEKGRDAVFEYIAAMDEKGPSPSQP
jgi:hypothetical protein